MKFNIKLSNSVLFSVLFVYILFFSILILVYFILSEYRVLNYCSLVFLSVFFGVMIRYGYHYKIYGYLLDKSQIEMENSWGKYPSIPLDDIEASEVIRGPFSRSIRLVGSWGFYGFYGEFKQIGGPHFTAYVTDTKNCVLLRMKGGGLIVISPHERELFLDELAKLRPGLPIRRKERNLQAPVET